VVKQFDDLKILFVLVIAFFAALALAYGGKANADTYINTVPMGCDDPTLRTDGTALDGVSKVLFYISDSVTDLPPPDQFSPLHTEIMTGGCADRSLDVSAWDTSKTYYKLAVAYDLEGRVSAYTPDYVPFSLDKAPPNAPVIH
jgi:hypothetical protein